MRGVLLFILMMCLPCLVQAQDQSQNSSTKTAGAQTAPNIVISNSTETQQSITQLFDQQASYQYFKKQHTEKLFDIPNKRRMPHD